MNTTPVRVDVLPLPAPHFGHLTYPRYAALLSSAQSRETLVDQIAVAAWHEDRPAGLALFSRAFPDGVRRLLSIMVSPELRRRGVGSRLLDRGEEIARTRGAATLMATHTTDLPARIAYEALMKRLGWSDPSPFEFRLAGKAGWALLARQDWAPFLRRVAARGFRATSWAEVTEEERRQIENIVRDLPEADRNRFDPFRTEKVATVIPDLSIVIRRSTTIVGWILGTRGALPDSVYYVDGYVLPELQRAGWLPAGVREISQRQAERMGAESVCLFATDATNHGMRRFMERQLARYSLWTHMRFVCEKRLIAPPGGSA